MKLEQRERTIGDLELRLGKKETDLAQYVGQLQAEMERRETDWWEKQLGKPVAAALGQTGAGSLRSTAQRRFRVSRRGPAADVHAQRSEGPAQERDPSTERSFLGQTSRPPDG